MPAFFTRELREELGAMTEQRDLMEVQLTAQEAAHEESVYHLTAVIRRLEDEVAALHAQSERVVKQSETSAHLFEVELARREGQIGELLFKGKLLDLTSQQHHWVRDGQTSAHGVVCDVWKCAECMKDSGCNPRVILPAGTRWRAVQDD